jgi:sialic acid synthase SpsE
VEFHIGTKQCSQHSRPLVIAEIGVNHEGSLQRARELINLAREGGADAVKFQTYKSERLASRYSPAYWDRSKEPTATQYELFKRYDTFDEEDYVSLADLCRKTGIEFISTPFDEIAVDFLAPLLSCFKIASADITNLPLIRKMAHWGKPTLLSTGASTVEEIEEAILTLRLGGCTEIALLHCVLAYPTPYEQANLNMIEGLRHRFPDHIIGYSDHTEPDDAMTVLVTAYLKGARLLEKHFTDDKTRPGNDHYHAMDVEDLKRLNQKIATIRVLEGQTEKSPVKVEENARRYARRSIVLTRPVGKGTIIDKSMLACKRPGTGISPVFWDRLIGMRAARDLDADQLIQWEDLADGQNPTGRAQQ